MNFRKFLLLVWFSSISILATVYAEGRMIDMDLVVWWTPKLKNKFNIDINERKVISGDIYIYPIIKPILSGSLLLPQSVEWYTILTTGVSFCSLVTRLSLERLTGKWSDTLRSGAIPKWDAVSLIMIGKRNGYLQSLWLLSGADSIYALEATFEQKTKKSPYSIRDSYLYHPSSYGLHKWHRFIIFKWSDNQNYIIDPILWVIHAKSKWWHEYFLSILELKNGSWLYLGRWYTPKKG